MDHEIGLELIKLLLQQAWADEEMVDEEAVHIRGLANQICGEDIDLVDTWLTQTVPLPPPNLSVLQAHRDEVLKALAQVTMADGKVHEDEREMIKLVSTLLR